MSPAEIRTTVLRSRKNVTRPAPSKAGLSARQIAEGKYDDSQAYSLKDQPERSLVICREMTKVHEEVIRTSIGEVGNVLSSLKVKGEFCVVLGPS